MAERASVEQDALNLVMMGGVWLSASGALATTLREPETSAMLFGGLGLLFPVYVSAVLVSAGAPDRLARDGIFLTVLASGAVMGIDGLSGSEGLVAGGAIAFWLAALSFTALAAGESYRKRSSTGSEPGAELRVNQLLVTMFYFAVLGAPVGLVLRIAPGPFGLAALLVGAARLTYPGSGESA